MASYEVPLDDNIGFEAPLDDQETMEDFEAKERKEKDEREIENVLCKKAIERTKKEFLGRLRSVAHNYARGLEIVGDTRSDEEQHQDEEITAILSQSGLAQTTRRGGKRTRKTKKHHKKHTKKHHKKHHKKHTKKH